MKESIRLLFDLTVTQPNHDGDFHGGGKYGKKVFLSLLEERMRSGGGIFTFFDSSKPIDPQIKDLVLINNIELIDINSIYLKDVVDRFKINRVYSASPFGLLKYGLKSLKEGECEVIGTIHGLRTLEIQMKIQNLNYVSSRHPKTYIKSLGKAIMSGYVAKRDKKRYEDIFGYTKLITVSNHTKYAIMSYFPDLKVDIPVYYSPDVTDFEINGEEESFSQPYKDYFLLVSGNRWLKNNMISVLALDQLFSERPEVQRKVIVTGVKDVGIYRKQITNTDLFIFLDYVSESYLQNLYKEAYAFLYMSLNEGFGYPPLEAMKWGVPVITSPFTSIPEVCGDAALYANPNSIQEIKNRILQLSDLNTYSRLCDMGKRRYLYIKDRQDSDLNKIAIMLLN